MGCRWGCSCWGGATTTRACCARRAGSRRRSKPADEDRRHPTLVQGEGRLSALHRAAEGEGAAVRRCAAPLAGSTLLALAHGSARGGEPEEGTMLVSEILRIKG